VVIDPHLFKMRKSPLFLKPLDAYWSRDPEFEEDHPPSKTNAHGSSGADEADLEPYKSAELPGVAYPQDSGSRGFVKKNAGCT